MVKELRRLERASGGRVRFFAVPNGGSRRRGEGARLKAAGVVAGVPDLIVLGAPRPLDAQPLSEAEIELLRAGVAHEPEDSLLRRLVATLDARRIFGLEMKREKGGVTSEAQAEWLGWFSERGASAVAHGAEDALRQIAAAGYPVRTTGY